MAHFTAETAASMARRSHEIRKARLELLQESRLAEEQAAKLAMTDTEKALSRTRSQIESVDKALDCCDDAREWDALTRAKERLFKQWVHLANIPGPGQRKPAPERTRPARPESPEIP